MFFEKMQNRKNDGFTLVELIVVIAILAILAGIGVPAYSGYVEKANIAADQQLIREVANALSLYYYDNYEAAPSGYVVLSSSAEPSGSMTVALNAVYGSEEEWKALRLKDDGWDAAAINEAANNKYAASIPGSTYIENIGTEKVLGDVQDCAVSFSQFLKDYTNNNPAAAVETLKSNLGADQVNKLLADAGYKAEDGYKGITTDVLANITVFGVAGNVKGSEADVINGFANYQGGFLEKNLSYTSSLTDVANWYAAGEALVAYLDDPTCNDLFKQIDMTGDAVSIIDSMQYAYSQIQSTIGANPDTLGAKTTAYYTPPENGKSQAQMDGEAYFGIMSTVNNLQDDYVKDETAMKDGNLFTSGAMQNRVDNFVSATEMVNELGGDVSVLQGISGSGAVVYLRADGTVTPIASNR